MVGGEQRGALFDGDPRAHSPKNSKASCLSQCSRLAGASKLQMRDDEPTKPSGRLRGAVESACPDAAAVVQSPRAWHGRNLDP